jgi:hypothetical protein
MGERMQRWLQSDLVGVFATITVIVVVALALFVFLVVGPVAGILFGVAIVGLTFYVLSKTGHRAAEDIGDIAPPSAESAQQVLVVANRGLASPDLESELARRAKLGPLQVRVLAPAPAASTVRRLADDVDAVAAGARQRVNDVLGRLAAMQIDASGQVDEGSSPMDSLLDGLREFPADEVLLVPGVEPDWDEAETLAERIRSETNIRVTELGG